MYSEMYYIQEGQRNALPLYNKDVMKLILVILIISSSLFAYDFQHIRFSEQYVSGGFTGDRGESGNRRGERRDRGRRVNLRKLNRHVSASILGMDDMDDSMPPLLQRIRDGLGNRYERIGEQEARDVLFNRDFGGGVRNFSGFSWQKPLVNIGLDVNREVAPNLFGDQWLVHDTLYIVINAQSLLGQLNEDGILDMSKSEIGAFAGVGFVREYKYTHLANSYIEGLTSDFSKLFLSFTKFQPNEVLNMPPYELMSREDKYTFNAGGFVSSPPVQGVSVRAGVLVNVGYSNKLTIQSLGENDSPKENEFLRMSIDKEVSAGVDVHLSLQADFFNLLQVTILSWDLGYEFASSNKTYLSFYEEDKDRFARDSRKWDEFSALVKSQTQDVNALVENVVTLEQRKRENLTSQFSFLLAGSLKKRETEQVRIIKEGVEKVFFKHYSESIKFIQNFFSRIFNKIIYKLFDWDIGVKNAAESKKTMKVEFESIAGIGQGNVEDEKDFSLQFNMEFKTAKTHRWFHKLYRREAIKHLGLITNLESDYAQLVDQKKLRGPLAIKTKVVVESAGLEYFSSLDENQIFDTLMHVCKSSNSKWRDAERRKKALRRIQIGKSNRCMKLLGNKFMEYHEDRVQFLRINLMKLKSFLGSYFKRISRYTDFFYLFGEENTFLTGEFSATSEQGGSFKTYFNQGDFRGLGVIDTFMRDGVSDIPTPINTK